VPSGDGRWLGRGYVVEKATVREQPVVLRARRVGTSEVGKGQLGVRLALATLTKEDGAAFEQADRVIRILERHDTPPRGSSIMEYVRTRSAWSEVNAMRASAKRVYALTTYGTYLCQSSQQSVLVVQRDTPKGMSPDGLYAEVWATSW